eukprot:2275866-Pyramimonas_sp.AAC.1
MTSISSQLASRGLKPPHPLPAHSRGVTLTQGPSAHASRKMNQPTRMAPHERMHFNSESAGPGIVYPSRVQTPSDDSSWPKMAPAT